MIASLVTSGLLGFGLASGGLMPVGATSIVYIDLDPYSTIAASDTGSLELNPYGTIAAQATGVLQLNPRATITASS